MHRTLVVASILSLLAAGCGADADEPAADPSSVAAAGGDAYDDAPAARRASPPGRAGAGAASAAPDAAPPADPVEEMRDPRRARSAPRSPALLATEVQGLESLAQASAPGSPDRPAVLRRLAEDYVELEAAALRDRSPAAPSRTAERARAAAIRWYGKLVAEAAASTYPQLDEARYFLAWEYERSGDLADARRLYLDLVSKNASSRYAPLAYFAFGEMFLHESEGGGDASKLPVAAEAYEKVASSPPPGNAAYGWAWVRLAQIAEKQGDRARALAAYRRADDFARLFPQLPSARGVAAAIPAWVAGAS